MQRYIKQLIEDLEDAADKKHTPAYIEAPPHLENMPDIAELALVPFKTISELTGIDQICFPEFTKLTFRQAKSVNNAIFKLLESFNIKVIDVPEDLPPELLYDVLTYSWDMYVQYLPSSGFDLELCTYDKMTCPYGDFCDCRNDDDSRSENDMPPVRREQDIDDVILPF